MIRVAVSGLGQMGRVVVEAVEATEDLQVVGILQPRHEIEEYRSASGTVYDSFDEPGTLFAATHPDVVVDFTNAQYTPTLLPAVFDAGVRPVIGTSGIGGATLEALRNGCAEQRLGGVLAPNFALGAVVLMHLSALAAKYFDTAEVIELHHDRKVDSPSGTALATARMMRAARGEDFRYRTSDLEHLPGARGALEGGVGLHSVRLPGYVASQEVILGGQGQTLSLRHDTISRECYMPGVILAVREVMQRDRLVEGLDALIGLR
jgi:4-hydroxy-tetrahydrodipicolinate reductase